jgi:hypothetical protein
VAGRFSIFARRQLAWPGLSGIIGFVFLPGLAHSALTPDSIVGKLFSNYRATTVQGIEILTGKRVSRSFALHGARGEEGSFVSGGRGIFTHPGAAELRAAFAYLKSRANNAPSRRIYEYPAWGAIGGPWPRLKLFRQRD